MYPTWAKNVAPAGALWWRHYPLSPPLPIHILCAACAGGVNCSSLVVYTPTTHLPQQIVLTSETDWGANSTRCPDMVARAAALGQTRVMFVPTLYFVDNEPRNYSAPGQQARVSYFCYGKDAAGNCPPATVEGRARFQAGMTACLRAAVARGLSLALAPHVDDGAPGSGAWRQGLVFDPLKPHSVPWGGDAMSYDDFILAPLAAAVAATSTAATKVWFSTQGEMGATLVYHPTSHTKLVAKLMERVIAGRAPAAFPPTNVKVGVLSNADKLCSCVTQTGNGTYTDDFVRGWATVAPQFNVTAIQALFAAVDFVGISNYPSLKSPLVKPSDFEAGITSFATELAQFGVNLKSLVTTGGKSLWFSEVGVGGGADAGGWSKTTDPAFAAANTFYGVTSTYRSDADPWHNGGTAVTPMLTLLSRFYGSLIRYVESRGALGPGVWPIDGAFLWNCGSWDVQAVHPASTAPDGSIDPTTGVGSYADSATIKMIAAHNAAAAAPAGVPLTGAALEAVLVAPVGSGVVNASAGAKKPGAVPAPTAPGATADGGVGAPVPRPVPDPSVSKPAGADKSTPHGASDSGGADDAPAEGDVPTALPTPPPTPNAVPSPVGTSVLAGPPRGLIGSAIAALRRAATVETTDDGGASDADLGASSTPDNPLTALAAVGHSLFGLEPAGGDTGGARV